MTNLLNIEKLKLYISYGGDIDGFCRSRNSKEKAVFGENLDVCWTLISNIFQDIELISKNLTSDEFIQKTLIELYDNCDVETYVYITDKIVSYKDFKNLDYR